MPTVSWGRFFPRGWTLVLAGSVLLPGRVEAQSECLRPDAEKMKTAIAQSMARGATADIPRIQKKVDGCIPYTVTLATRLTATAATVTTTITGYGTLTLQLAPDPSEPEYALTSGPDHVIGTVIWTDVTMTGGECTHAVTPSPPTEFEFWLGIAPGGDARADVVVVPGGDLHQVATRCGNGSRPPVPTPIFAPYWTLLHAMGNPAASQPLGGVSMDPAAVQAMAQKFKDRQPTMEEAMAMMKQMVPDAGKQIAAAQENFMLKVSGSGAGARAGFPRHTIDRTVAIPGGGTLHELTVVEIVRKPAGK